MNLLIHIHATISAAEETHIIKCPVFLYQWHGTRDDIDVIADSQLTETVTDLFRILSHFTNTLRFTHVIKLRHQRSIKVFWEKDKITLIVRHGIHKELHLFKEIIHRSIRTHLPLNQSDTHRRFLIYKTIRWWLVIDIIPLQQCGAVFTLLITWQIIADDTTDVEIIAQLEREYRVVDFTGAHLLDILLRTHLIRILMIVRNTTTKHDCLQIQLFAQFLAILVHTACQSQATVIRVDKHLNTIENITIRIMCIESLVTSHLRISMITLHHIIINDDRQGTSYNLIIHDDDNLTFRKYSNEFLDLLACPEHVRISVDTLERFSELVIILHVEISQAHLFDFTNGFHNTTFYL